MNSIWDVGGEVLAYINFHPTIFIREFDNVVSPWHRKSLLPESESIDKKLQHFSIHIRPCQQWSDFTHASFTNLSFKICYSNQVICIVICQYIFGPRSYSMLNFNSFEYPFVIIVCVERSSIHINCLMFYSIFFTQHAHAMFGYWAKFLWCDLLWSLCELDCQLVRDHEIRFLCLCGERNTSKPQQILSAHRPSSISHGDFQSL